MFRPVVVIVIALLITTVVPVAPTGSTPFGPGVPPADLPESEGPMVSATDRPGRADGGIDEPAILAAYPNPVARYDEGEFVVVRVPPGGNWTLAVGQQTVHLPVDASGRLAVGDAAARPLVDAPFHEAALGLANAGEDIVLRRDGRPAAWFRYRDAPEGDVRRDGQWRPLGATDRPVVHTGGGSARAFVLPDAPVVPLHTLQEADQRVFLAGYTFTSHRVADALIAARARNVSVRVLVEGRPVSGMTRRQARLLDRLVTVGIDVRVVGGPYARYDFHHAKYAVVDGRALVLTENWKPAGTGGRSSRGWGVEVRDAAAADALAATFRADATWRDAIPWTSYSRGRAFRPSPTANGSYPTRVAPETFPVSSTRVILAPDNAERAVVGLIANATESVRVIQPSVSGVRQPFVRAVLNAARRGVRVRLLVGGAWYNRDDNRAIAEHLNDRADAAGLPLSVRVAESAGRYEKIHAKGVVVDEERVLLGSLNWNNHSMRANREVAVVLDGPDVAGYYAGVFDGDWTAGDRGVPVGLLAGLVVATLVGLWTVRRMRFGDGLR